MSEWREYPQLPYLHGWLRLGVDSILMGTGVHCIGCGAFEGTACVAFPEDWHAPGPEPDWPYSQDACPVCYWRDIWRKGGFDPQENPILDRLGRPKMVGPKHPLP